IQVKDGERPPARQIHVRSPDGDAAAKVHGAGAHADFALLGGVHRRLATALQAGRQDRHVHAELRQPHDRRQQLHGRAPPEDGEGTRTVMDR
ncbi:hypothetical protein PFISCL1PPCAC_9275, partial [Pristionchus fissidentatus]